ncbi:MAG: hypothetical protein FWF98_00905 [Dehalococcoidia bacterium]|nr:hypothetical protein [Dehalococcoidia bacterium]
MSDSWRTCDACGRQAEIGPNQDIGDALRGWVIISRLRGKDSFERCSFCSICCLQQWAQTQVATIPDVFLHSLSDSPCNL